MNKLIIGFLIVIVLIVFMLGMVIDGSNNAIRNRRFVSTVRGVVQSKKYPEVKEDAWSGEKGTSNPIFSINGELYQYDVNLEEKDSVAINWYKYPNDTALVYELVKI